MLLMLLSVALRSEASVLYSINYDNKTVAAMATSFATEVAAEKYYNEQVQKILERYSAAEVAAAGIYASKYLDRKALTELGILDSRTENYYYRRIYTMVSAKIMPKIWTVAKMMISSPQTAMYWGSYLLKVCADTKALCMQFESIVTNSRLGFSDISFLELNPQVAQLFTLSNTGNIDWKQFLDDFGNIRNSFTVANLRSDIDKLYNYGVGLANTGTENVLNRLLQRSDFHGLVSDRITYIANVVNNSYSFYKSLDQSIGNTLLSLIGGKEDVSRLFTFSNYDLTSWLSDYRSSELGQYYTQRWYIYRQDSGEEVIFDYTPATDTESIAKGGEWVRFTTTDSEFYPTPTQLKQVLANSETYAGHTIDEINQLASSNDGYSYEVTRKLKCYALTSKGKQYAKAYAYAIKAVRSWDKKEEVYEDTFDSYSMDFDTFSALMNQQLAELNDNEDGSKYYLDSDSKRYYLSANSTKIQGSESVIISVTCSDSATLIEGNTQYKCKTCGTALDDHTKECSMLTTITDNEISTAELDKLEKQYAQQAYLLQAQIDELEAENAELSAKIATASTKEAIIYRRQYNNNRTNIQEYTTQLNDIKKKQAALEEARQEAETDDEVQTDDYYRIPAIMNDCKTAYSLTWKGDGVWSGFTFTREASAPNINGTIKFVATLKMVRKPKTFLGIKIHRAIIGIEWKLTADYTDSQVVEVVELDKSKSDKENTQLVNDKISEVAQDYPSCTITTEYIGNEELEADASVDTQHLLWASDRLEIAREIDSRITKIYTDLVSLEKFMHYKRSIVDVLKDIAPSLNATQGKKLTITEEAHERWMNSAKYLGKEGGTK